MHAGEMQDTPFLNTLYDSTVVLVCEQTTEVIGHRNMFPLLLEVALVKSNLQVHAMPTRVDTMSDAPLTQLESERTSKCVQLQSTGLHLETKLQV